MEIYFNRIIVQMHKLNRSHGSNLMVINAKQIAKQIHKVTDSFQVIDK